MKPVYIVTTRLPGMLLRIALRRRNIDPSTFYFYEEDASEHSAPSLFVLGIQAGGVKAFSEMSISPSTLYSLGYRMEEVVVFDGEGKNPITLPLSMASQTFFPFWVAPGKLREVVEVTLKDLAASGHEHHEDSGDWREVRCPGILLLKARGKLTHPRTHFIWNSDHAYVGISHVSTSEILMYAVPRMSGDKGEEEKIARRSLAEAQEKFARFFTEPPHILASDWFPLHSIGYRPVAHNGVARWGSASLRLHPFTGQSISYWAIQSNRFAEEFSRHGEISPSFIRALNRAHRTVFNQHVHTMNYYLRPNLFWKLIYRPYAALIRHSPYLQKRVVKRLALL